MLRAMSESTSTPEPATAPVATTTPPPQPTYVEREPRRSQALRGRRVGRHRRRRRLHRRGHLLQRLHPRCACGRPPRSPRRRGSRLRDVHRGGPPPMFQMGPMGQSDGSDGSAIRTPTVRTRRTGLPAGASAADVRTRPPVTLSPSVRFCTPPRVSRTKLHTRRGFELLQYGGFLDEAQPMTAAQQHRGDDN